MSEAAQHIFEEWTLPFWMTLSVVITGIIYIRGWIAIRVTRPQQFNAVRLAAFLCGLTILWLAIGSPMDGFADALLSVHMVEHLLLMSVVPPLLLWGLPVVPILRGLPLWMMHLLITPLIRVRSLRGLSHWLTTPLVAWFAMNVSLLAWHIPRAYDFALEHEGWHAVEHLCFLGTSILFWQCIVRPWPTEPRNRSSRSWGILLFLVSADIVNTLLSASLAFCGRPVYNFYLNQLNPFQVSPLEDQVLGAVIMWVIGSFAFLVPAMSITIRLLQPRNLTSKPVEA